MIPPISGVLVLRRTQPQRPRLFRVPFVPLFPLTSIVLCVALMSGLTLMTWLRFAGWLFIGLVIYALYSRRRSAFAAERGEKSGGINGVTALSSAT